MATAGRLTPGGRDGLRAVCRTDPRASPEGRSRGGSSCRALDRLLGPGGGHWPDCITDLLGRDIKAGNLAPLYRNKNFISSRRHSRRRRSTFFRWLHSFFHWAASPLACSWWPISRLHSHKWTRLKRLLEALNYVRDAPGLLVSGGLRRCRPRALRRTLGSSARRTRSRSSRRALCHLSVQSRVPAVRCAIPRLGITAARPGLPRFISAALQANPLRLLRRRTYAASTFSTCVGGDRWRRATAGGLQRLYIGGGSRVTINHVLDLIARRTGRSLDVRRQPAEKGDMRDTWADTSLARADLGFQPSQTLEAGLAAECEWLARLLGRPLPEA